MKLKRFLRIIGLTMLCLAALGLCACGGDEQGAGGRPEVTTDLLAQQPQNSVTVFYQAADSEVLVPLVYGINSSRDTIWIALDRLLAGPADSFCRAVVPAGVKMKDLYYANGTVNVSLTGDGELSAEEINAEAIFATVNNELTEQKNEQAPVQVYYNDQPLFEKPFYCDAVNDFGGGREGSYVYFSDSQAMYVVPLKLAVNRDDYKQPEDYLAALLKAWQNEPPAASGLYTAALSDCRLAVSLSDGLLTLDFDRELSEISGTAQETLFVNTLLATLADVEYVEAVRFTVNGEPVAMLSHGTDLSEPLPVPHDEFVFNVVNN